MPAIHRCQNITMKQLINFDNWQILKDSVEIAKNEIDNERTRKYFIFWNQKEHRLVWN